MSPVSIHDCKLNLSAHHSVGAHTTQWERTTARKEKQQQRRGVLRDLPGKKRPRQMPAALEALSFLLGTAEFMAILRIWDVKCCAFGVLTAAEDTEQQEPEQPDDHQPIDCR